MESYWWVYIGAALIFLTGMGYALCKGNDTKGPPDSQK